MFKRKLFSREDIALEFQHIMRGWNRMTRDYPAMRKAVFAAQLSAPVVRQGEKMGLTMLSREHRMIEGLTLFYTLMGPRITKELLAIGQNPVLASLMVVKGHLLNPEFMKGRVDVQPVLLLTALRYIAQHQGFLEEDVFLLQLVNELRLEEEFHDKVIDLALSLGWLHEQRKQEGLSHARSGH